ESKTSRSWNAPSQASTLTSQEEVLINNKASINSQKKEHKPLEEKRVLASDWQEEFKKEYLRKYPGEVLQKTEATEKSAYSQGQGPKTLEEKWALASDWQEEFKREYLKKYPGEAL